MYEVIVDPGHGGRKPGAVGPTGLLEKDVTFDLSLMLAKRMNEGTGTVHAILTRETDIHMSLMERAQFANTFGGKCLVSIHCNSYFSETASGFEIFTSPGVTDADRLATDIWLRFRERFPDRRPRLDMSDGDVDKEARFTVLTESIMPAVLFEVGFISNPEEEDLLRDQSWLWNVSGVIDNAVRSWCSTR